jgi:hypothetical protein
MPRRPFLNLAPQAGAAAGFALVLDSPPPFFVFSFSRKAFAALADALEPLFLFF